MVDSLAGVQGGYDKWSDIYDSDGNPILPLEEPLVHSMCGQVDGKSAVDLGCGTARHSLWLAGHGTVVTAVDFSEGMLAAAAKKPGAEKIRFVRHDLHRPLPFADRQFDLAVSGMVLEHLRDLEMFFRECARIVKIDGRVVVSTIHPAMHLRGIIARFTDPQTGQVVHPGSVEHGTSDLFRSVARSGLQIEDVQERSADSALARQFPRAEKYIGWPMVLVIAARRAKE